MSNNVAEEMLEIYKQETEEGYTSVEGTQALVSKLETVPEKDRGQVFADFEAAVRNFLNG